ncbi:MAG: hypothetical protein ACOY3L_03280 [Pseudomonadota bacterium]
MPASADSWARLTSVPEPVNRGDGNLVGLLALQFLLLAFFILLTSVTHVELDRARPVMESLAEQFAGVLDEGPRADLDGAAAIGDVRLLRDRIQALLANALPLARVRQARESDRLLIELPLDGFFERGETSLGPLARARLARLLDAVREGMGAAPYRIGLAVPTGDGAVLRAAALAAGMIDAGVRSDRLSLSLDRRAAAQSLVFTLLPGDVSGPKPAAGGSR